MGKYVYAMFNGDPGGSMDKAAKSIMEGMGGSFVGAGTMLSTGDRDIQFKFDDDAMADNAVNALKSAGFRTMARDIPWNVY